MARPIKDGLNYFPLDVNFFEDERLEGIAVKFGIEGELACIKLLCFIYKNGYYIEWSEMLEIKMLKAIPSLTSKNMSLIIKQLCLWKFFNEELFKKHKVLTSTEIQEQFKEVRRRRRGINFNELPFWIATEKKPEKKQKTCKQLTATSNNLPNKTNQRKEKEKETKEERKENNKQDDVLRTCHNLMQFFAYTEQQNPDAMLQFGKLACTLKSNKKLDYFDTQFKAYKEYKKLSGERTHNWKSFIGSKCKDFIDGGWNANNWVLQLEKLQQKKKSKDILPQHMKHESGFNNEYNF